MKNKRIVVVGTSGSGKTTLARKLAAKHNIPHIELDVLYWQPGWVETPMPEFIGKIETALHENTDWVICGNYNVAKNITLPAATDIVWLDTPLYVNLWRVLKRSVVRWLTGKESFAGCPETFSHIFLTKKSLLLWVWNTHAERRRKYTTMLTAANYPQAQIHIVKNSTEYNRALLLI
ncbi:MAG TPA: hypothetical protein PLW44_06485 [Chitinophagales bacterium]|nr:hypothetical protein [Chitinophagales bacterium]